MRPKDFYVDSPQVNTWQEPDIEVGGWIWGGAEDPVVRVALESGAWSHPLDFGLERGDVATYLGEPQAALSGFHARLELPVSMGSDQSLQLVAYRQSGERDRDESHSLPPRETVDFMAAVA